MGADSDPAMTEDTPADPGADQATVDADALTTGASQPADDAAPAEETTVAAAEPAPPPAPAPAPAATRRTSDGKLIHMPRKGRLFPWWGKRE